MSVEWTWTGSSAAEGTKLTGQRRQNRRRGGGGKRASIQCTARRFKITRARLNTLSRHRDEK